MHICANTEVVQMQICRLLSAKPLSEKKMLDFVYWTLGKAHLSEI